MVAKSYEASTIISNPYDKNGKPYVKVQMPCKRCGGSGHYSRNASGDTTCYRCGGTKYEVHEVRWYTDKERERMDAAAEKRIQDRKEKQEQYKAEHTDKRRFGFERDNGVLIFKGEYEDVKNYIDTLAPHTARYCTWFGWYIGDWATESLELNVPNGVEAIFLPWEAVGKDDGTFKSEEERKAAVASLCYVPSKSEYQGTVGDKYSGTLTCIKIIDAQSPFGISHIHTFEDSDGNIFIWMTTSKRLEEKKTYMMNAKIKEHREYKGVKQTILNYCRTKEI